MRYKKLMKFDGKRYDKQEMERMERMIA